MGRVTSLDVQQSLLRRRPLTYYGRSQDVIPWTDEIQFNGIYCSTPSTDVVMSAIWGWVVNRECHSQVNGMFSYLCNLICSLRAGHASGCLRILLDSGFWLIVWSYQEASEGKQRVTSVCYGLG